MSWDKNTIDMSNLDSIKEMLDELEIPYKLENKQSVMGRGLNDDSDKYYDLRRLEYRDKVILECMTQTTDCDSDDCLVSYKLDSKDEPKRWRYIKVINNCLDEL